MIFKVLSCPSRWSRSQGHLGAGSAWPQTSLGPHMAMSSLMHTETQGACQGQEACTCAHRKENKHSEIFRPHLLTSVSLIPTEIKLEHLRSDCNKSNKNIRPTSTKAEISLKCERNLPFPLMKHCSSSCATGHG